MSDDDNEGATAFTKNVQALSHEPRADALPLAIRQDRYRCEAHPDHVRPRSLHGHRRKENVPNDRTIVGDQRQRVHARVPQVLDEVGLRRAAERKLVDMPNAGGILRPFWAN
jgi:hypothetical protein